MAQKTKIIIAVVLAVLLAGGGYFYWKYKAEKLTPEEAAVKTASESAETITESAAKGALPSINPQSNPLEEQPDVNPISPTNPFKGLKTNPFE